MSCEESKQDISADQLIAKAKQVWHVDTANNWLHSSIPALGGRTPISLFKNSEGRRAVWTILEKIERGEFS